MSGLSLLSNPSIFVVKFAEIDDDILASHIFATMRYQSWDVLLFPLESRIPFQEFDTKCFALDQGQ